MTHASDAAWEHRHPLTAFRAARLLGRLPVLVCDPSHLPEGQILRSRLTRARFGMSTRLHEAASVLELPATPGEYSLGPARATQRRHARKALKLGVTWRLVGDRSDRRQLLADADDFERRHPRRSLRSEEPDNADLLDLDLWIAAFHEDRPILLTAVVQDGEWSMLRYFRIVDDSAAASHARYLMTGVLADELSSRGARFLIDTVSPFRLNPGLHHFSRMVGFRLQRVRIA